MTVRKIHKNQSRHDRNYKERNMARGISRITVQCPDHRKEELRRLVARWREEFERENLRRIKVVR